MNPDIFNPEIPSKGELFHWQGLPGDALPLAIANAADKAPGPVIVLAPDMRSAELLEEKIRFYSNEKNLDIFIFPDWETLPYDTFSPHQDIISSRLAALYKLPECSKGIIITSVNTLSQKLLPRIHLFKSSLILDKSMKVDSEELRNRFINAGYRYVSQVMEHGEFAIRGSLIDIYPMGSNAPVRIDLLDDEIEHIKRFDTENQRSTSDIDAIRLLPAREIPLDDEGTKHFRKAFREFYDGNPQDSPVYREVSAGNCPGGIEYYLPLFYDKTDTFFDYLPESALVIKLDATSEAFERLVDEYTDRYSDRCDNKEHPALPPERLILDSKTFEEQLSGYPIIDTSIISVPASATQSIDFNVAQLGNVRIHPRQDAPASAIQKLVDECSGRILFTAETTGRRETLIDQLRGFSIQPAIVDSWQAFETGSAQLAITAAPLEAGLLLASANIAIVTEADLFGEHIRQKRRRKPSRDPATIIRDLTDLSTGSPVVHEHHGVGRYLGLESLAVDGIQSEYLSIEYSGNDKLYVPVSSLELISRYTGASPENAPLHKLGSDQWQNARKKASKQIHDIAVELLDIYARRAAKKGFAFMSPGDDYAEFSATFPFEETPDQETSIEAVLDDMRSDRPMDRVVCGDVGFGKTEVCMRAAFLAVQNSKQVVILVPTTLLAQQHYQNFKDRFADWPVRIEVLSRFQASSQQKEVIAGLENGQVDLVIGTHKLIQSKIAFKRLGLLVIDEEHRFGVKQKEKIKSLRAEVDILTLTATPIPRTLNMSLSGLRDLSIISTPPQHRLAVSTFVSEWDNTLLREACLREIKRGGQIYFLHNEVDSISRIAAELADIIPEATIEIAHGQMREKDLERVMFDFYHRRFNLLVCTTIIESGIDIPTANTIIMNRADKLGLAQLHQLRGRVGRSHHKAYAYLLVPPRRAMSKDAVKRIEAIESMKSLGAGFTLATHDMEIRGAGELLGDDQSGQIHEIGFSLFSELLERAVTALKDGRQPNLEKPLHQGVEVDLLLPALIPGDYVADVHIRLVLYKRIAGGKTTDELRELQVEMIDRFGLLPDPVKNLFAVTAIKLAAEPMGIRKIEVGKKEGRIVFNDQPAIDTRIILDLIENTPEKFRFSGANSFRFSGEYDDETMRFQSVMEILRKFSEPIDHSG